MHDQNVLIRCAQWGAGPLREFEAIKGSRLGMRLEEIRERAARAAFAKPVDTERTKKVTVAM